MALPKLWLPIALPCLLALVAGPVWQAREQWHFAQSFDDSVYYVTAKSIAEGKGPRVANLPGEPYAVKYPPLYPLYLSLAWLADGAFPRNLQVASLLQALLLPVYLALLLAVLRGMGLSLRRTMLVAALTVVTLHMVLLTVTLMSELLFGCFLLAAMLAAGRAGGEGEDGPERARWALAAGLLAGLAYLTRNAALPLLAVVPLHFFLRGRFRLTLPFALAAAPLACGWHLWSWAHTLKNPDPYNASYLNEYARVMSVTGLWEHLGRQVGTLSGAVAEGLLPGLVDFVRGLPLYHLVPAAALMGAVRLGRRRQWPVEILFTGAYLALIVAWWFEGQGRMIIPVWPILLAGFAEEASHFADLCAQPMKSARWKNGPRWALVALGFVLVAANDAYAWGRISKVVAEEREARMKNEPAFAWVRGQKSAETLVLAWKDAALYLWTGLPASHGLFVKVTPQVESVRVLSAQFSALPEQYRQGLLVILCSDLHGGFSEAFLREFRAKAEALPESELSYRSESALVYRFKLPRD